MTTTITLAGRISSGMKWVTNSWDKMVNAHDHSLTAYHRGTLNVNLVTPWTPPDDEKHSFAAHAEGIQKGVGFLQRGNYVHPDITVVEIGGVAISGQLYFPAGLNADFQFIAHSRNRLEILSSQRIRERLGLREDEEKDVDVVLEIL